MLRLQFRDLVVFPRVSTKAVGALVMAALLASCSGGGNLPQSRSLSAAPQSRSFVTAPQSLASCFRSAPFSERLHAAAGCRVSIAHAATLHRSRTPLNLAGSAGITVFDVPDAATASICSPNELFVDCGTNVAGINNAGTVTGYYLNTNHERIGFIRSAGGQFTSFKAPGVTVPGGGTVATTISDNGAIAGQFVAEDLVVMHAWIRQPDGTFVNADAPFASYDPTSASRQGSYVNSINVRGEAAGVWFNVQGGPHGFIRSADGTFVQVVPPNASANDVCASDCLNAAGTAMGAFATTPGGPEFAYIRTAASEYAIFGPPGAPFTNSSGINAGGEAAGYYFDSNFVQGAYTRDRGGTISPFQAPDADLSPGNGSNADAINNAGAIAGAYFDSSGSAHGFYRSPSGRFAEFDPTNSVFTITIGITSSGKIAGEWLDAQGQVHGFLWLPH